MKARLTPAILVVAVLSLTGAPAAMAVPDGIYKGEAEGELKVRIKVKDDRITKFESSVYAYCYSDSFIRSFAYPPAGRKGATAKIKANGSFKVVFKGSPTVSFNDDKRTLAGRFTGGRVTGSMKVRGLCTADSTFTARR